MKATVELVVTKAVKQLRSVSRSKSPVASTSTTPTTPEITTDEKEIIPSTPSPKKRARVMKPKEPKTYIIPDVVQLPTTFKGRLGYACLNTILRDRKPSVFCARTCRIKTIEDEGMDYLKELGRKNAEDLSELIRFNHFHHIHFLRLSSEMFPFAAHLKYQYTLEHADKELKEAGRLAKEYGVRITLHPGQYNSLGSPRPEVIENAIRDLTYQNEMLERMDLGAQGKDSVMIVHGGGVYGDKVETLVRFKENFRKLPQAVQNRLVLENDEMCWNVDDLLPLCEELGIPLCYDYHHGWIFPSKQSVAELMPRILATWTKKGIKPKQHLSSPRRGAVTKAELRAHADRCQTLPAELPDDMDLMIEAKDKEQAVFHLYRIYNLHPVIHEDLRPPAEEETTQTAGRKSNKKKKIQEGEVGDVDMLDGEDGEDVKSSPAKSKSPRKSRAKVKVEKLEVELEGEDVDILPKETEEDVKASIQTKSPRKSRAKIKIEAVEAVEDISEEITRDDSNSLEEVDEEKPVITKSKSPVKSRSKKVVKIKVELSDEDSDAYEDSGEEQEEAYGDSEQEEVMPKKKIRKLE